jgi:adenylate cyclase
MRSTGQRVYPVKIITIYGYANFIYLLVTFLALIPKNIVKVSALGYAGVASLIHLLVSLTHEVKKQTASPRTLCVVCLYVLAVQLIVLYLIKDKFFHHIRLEL